MRKEYLTLLKEEAARTAETFSNRTTEISNHANNNLNFEVEVIAPMSDETATVTFKKNDGIRALAFFYLLKYKNGPVWKYFFPTDSHICGMSDFARRKSIIEEANYTFRTMNEAKQ